MTGSYSALTLQWRKNQRRIDSIALFSTANYPRIRTCLHPHPYYRPLHPNLRLSSTITGLAIHFARISSTRRLEYPSWHAQSPLKASALHGFFLAHSSCHIPCLHQFLLRNTGPTFSPHPRSTVLLPAPAAGRNTGLWLAVAVTVHFLTGQGGIT